MNELILQAFIRKQLYPLGIVRKFLSQNHRNNNIVLKLRARTSLEVDHCHRFTTPRRVSTEWTDRGPSRCTQNDTKLSCM